MLRTGHSGANPTEKGKAAGFLVRAASLIGAWPAGSSASALWWELLIQSVIDSNTENLPVAEMLCRKAYSPAMWEKPIWVKPILVNEY